MSSNKKSSGSANMKPSAKSSKAEKASFDKVITALEKENEAYVTPTAQKTLFYVASVVAAASPLVLFWGSSSSTNWSAVYEGRVHENLVWYLVCVVVSVLALAHNYNVVATRTRRQLLISREAVGSGERATKELKAVTANESAYWALFNINTLYLALFLLNVRYVLPAQELSERVNFALSTLGAAAVTVATVAFKAL